MFETEGAVGARMPAGIDEEPRAVKGPKAFVERTLTLDGSAAPVTTAAPVATTTAPTAPVVAATGAKEISVPITIPAGGKREIVIRISIEARD